MRTDVGVLLDKGRAALAACDWEAAQRCFEEAACAGDGPEALDGLGQALYWQGKYPQAIAFRERAYALYRGRGEQRAAALVAVRLAALHGAIFGNEAAVGGWLGHAERMLEGCGDCSEQGWFELFLASVAHDPAERQRRAEAAIQNGRRHGEPNLEFDALACAGRVLVEQSEVGEGMRRIDEAVAAVTSGVVTDPWAAGEIYCTLFDACELAMDIARAEAWLRAVDRYVERTNELPIAGVCRMHYGGLLAMAGRWDEAERQLETALAIYDGTFVGTRFEPMLRLADLRVRQGRLEEAERLLEGYQGLPQAVLPAARLALERGQPEVAEQIVERYLARRSRSIASAPVLALVVQVKLALGDLEGASTGVVALTALAQACGQPALAGLAALSTARVGVATSDDRAKEWFDEALSAFSDAALPYEVSRTRLEFATELADTKPAVARSEARTALSCFQQLGARRDVDRAAQLLRDLGDRRCRTGKDQSLEPLTKRETDVLALLAEGLPNAEIAARLFVSPRTAEHHVGKILTKLGLANRAEAAAYAVRHGVRTDRRAKTSR